MWGISPDSQKKQQHRDQSSWSGFRDQFLIRIGGPWVYLTLTLSTSGLFSHYSYLYRQCVSCWQIVSCDLRRLDAWWDEVSCFVYWRRLWNVQPQLKYPKKYCSFFAWNLISMPRGISWWTQNLKLKPLEHFVRSSSLNIDGQKLKNPQKRHFCPNMGMFWHILAGGAMLICGQKSLFLFFSTFDHGGNEKWLFNDDFTLAKTCRNMPI